MANEIIPSQEAAAAAATPVPPDYQHRVTGIYPRRIDAESVQEQLLRYGFRPEQLEVVASPAQSAKTPGTAPDSEEVRNDVLIDGAIGTAVGTGLGAVGEIALAAANVSLFVASPIIGTLTMMGWGAALGGIVGAAVGAGNEQRHDFADLVRDATEKGHAVLIAYAESEEQATTARAVIGNSLREGHPATRIDSIE